jgi:hypothetical protein
MDYKIIDVIVIDLNDDINENLEYPIRLSGVSVAVKVELGKKEYFLNYQVFHTIDVGAINDDLETDGDEEGEIAAMFGIETDPHDFFNDVKKKVKVNAIWRKYVNETYELKDDRYSLFCDTSSRSNEAKRK